MKCWKCGKENPIGSNSCLYCQADLNRTLPVTDIGKAMRQIYDEYGGETVLKNSAYLVNGISDLVKEDCSRFRTRLKIAMECRIGELYLSQIQSPESQKDFEQMIRRILAEDAGFNEKIIGELMSAFDEMIGWPKEKTPEIPEPENLQEQEEIIEEEILSPEEPPIQSADPAPAVKTPKKKWWFAGGIAFALLAAIAGISGAGGSSKPSNDPVNAIQADPQQNADVSIPIDSASVEESVQEQEALPQESEPQLPPEQEILIADPIASEEGIIYVGVYDAPFPVQFTDKGYDSSSYYDLYGIYGQLIDRWNDAHSEITVNGKNRRIELVFASDMKGVFPDSTDAAQQKKMMEEVYPTAAADYFSKKNCAAVIGATPEGNKTLVKLVTESGIPCIYADTYIGGNSTNELVTFFSGNTADLWFGTYAPEFAVNVLNAKKLLYVYYEKYDSEDFIDYEKQMGKFGLTPYSVKCKSIAELQAVLKNDSQWDGIILSETVATYAFDGKELQNALNDFGCNAPIIYRRHFDNEASITNNYYSFCTPQHPEIESILAELRDEYAKAQNREMRGNSASAAMHIDAFDLLSKALSVCESRQELASAIRSQTLNGYHGSYVIDKDGHVQYNSVLYTTREGIFNYIRR